jgi:hypothetical protein
MSAPGASRVIALPLFNRVAGLQEFRTQGDKGEGAAMLPFRIRTKIAELLCRRIVHYINGPKGSRQKNRSAARGSPQA